MNQNCRGFFQKSRLRCRTIWARAVPKNKEKVGLYVSTQFKNGSDVTISLLEEKLVKP